MRLALVLVLTLTLTGCIAGPTVMGTGNVDEMRADLKACSLKNWELALIPDFGITADKDRVKCMRERGWVAGPDRSGGGIRDYARAETAPTEPLGPPNVRRPPEDGCPPGALWNEVQDTCMTVEPAPPWCAGTWTGVRCIR